MDLSARIEHWPLAGTFTISRGSKTEAVVAVAELGDGIHCGRGECVPYARYGETPDGIVAAINAMRPALNRGLDRAALQQAMPAGAARNALDCAYWDFCAKQAGRRVHELLGLAAPSPLLTAIRFRWRLLLPWQRRPSAQRRALCLKSSLAAATMAMKEGSRRCAVRRRAPS